MASCSARFPIAKNMSIKVNESLARLESAVAQHDWSNFEQLEKEAAERINQLAREVQDLDINSANGKTCFIFVFRFSCVFVVNTHNKPQTNTRDTHTRTQR